MKDPGPMPRPQRRAKMKQYQEPIEVKKGEKNFISNFHAKELATSHQDPK